MKSSEIWRDGCSLNTEFISAILAALRLASAFVGQFCAETMLPFSSTDARASGKQENKKTRKQEHKKTNSRPRGDGGRNQLEARAGRTVPSHAGRVIVAGRADGERGPRFGSVTNQSVGSLSATLPMRPAASMTLGVVSSVTIHHERDQKESDASSFFLISPAQLFSLSAAAVAALSLARPLFLHRCRLILLSSLASDFLFK